MGKINIKYFFLKFNLFANWKIKKDNPHQIDNKPLGTWSNKLDILWKLVSPWLLYFLKKVFDSQLNICCPQDISSKKKYIIDNKYLPQRGASFLLDDKDQIIYDYFSNDVLGYSSKMSDPLAFLLEKCK